MPEVDPVHDLRERAKSLINECQPVAGRLQQELPQLLIHGEHYRAAAQQYSAIHVRQRNILALRRIEDLARDRYRLMRDRYFTSQRSINAINDIRLANAVLISLQVAIVAGKIAEIWLAVGGWAQAAKPALDRAKLILDGVKANTGAIEGAIRNDAGAVGASALQTVAFRGRFGDEYQRLTKAIFDAGGSLRRFHTMKDFAQHVSAGLNLLKALADTMAAFMEWTNREALKPIAPHMKDIGRELGVVRDVVDGIRALFRAGQSVMVIWRSFDAMEMAELESQGYLGAGHMVMLDMNADFAAIHPAAIVADATSMGAAESLIQATKDLTHRIESDIYALDSQFWREATRIHVACQRVSPDLETAKQLLGRCNVQLTNLDIVVGRGGTRAEAAAPIRAALEGYRAYLASLVLQIESVVIPDIPPPTAPAPLPMFDLEAPPLPYH